MSLLAEALDAHGGLERWRSTREIRARVRTGGLLPRTRMSGNRLADYRVTVAVAEPHTVLDPFPGPGKIGVFDHGQVRIETANGEALESRADPRPAFSGASGLRRNLRWDPLDCVYFAGYAMWNYLTTPLLLTREGVEVSEGEPWEADGERLQRLEVTFPPGFETHSSRQTFYFDKLRLLRRHDYVAEVVGGWAHAAHHVGDHTEVGGLVFPTRRWVRPIGPGNRSLALPTLVSLKLSEIEVEAPGEGS
jgi:hypothetical protein